MVFWHSDQDMPLLALNCVDRMFLRKIKYLAKLLVGGSKSISSRVFVSATIADPVNVSNSLIQQCKMLESIIGVRFTC